ncbi:MAG: hypothetical protein ABI972_17505 [Acidobacteriota bacterium]
MSAGKSLATPGYDEYALALRGSIRVETRAGATHVTTGRVLFIAAGESVRYPAADENGAAFLAIYAAAFSPEAVHRKDV